MTRKKPQKPPDRSDIQDALVGAGEIHSIPGVRVEHEPAPAVVPTEEPVVEPVVEQPVVEPVQEQPVQEPVQEQPAVAEPVVVEQEEPVVEQPPQAAPEGKEAEQEPTEEAAEEPTPKPPQAAQEGKEPDISGRLTEAERAELAQLEEQVETGVRSVLAAMGIIRRRKLWREYGTWDQYCWKRWGHGDDWASQLENQARLQTLMAEKLKGFDIGQLDAKLIKGLEDHPDWVVAAYQEAFDASRGRRKSADVFAKAIRRYKEMSPLRNKYPDLTAQECRDLATLGAADGTVNFAVATKLGLKDTIILDTHRGEALAALAARGQKALELIVKEQKRKRRLEEAVEAIKESGVTLAEIVSKIHPDKQLVDKVTPEMEARARVEAERKAAEAIAAAHPEDKQDARAEQEEPVEEEAQTTLRFLVFRCELSEAEFDALDVGELWGVTCQGEDVEHSRLVEIYMPEEEDEEEDKA
jgi:hypothetical protein